MKKLVCFIPTAGKSKERIVKETWESYQKYLKAEHLKKEEKKIPEGFIKCEVCGEYNGETKMKNLDWGSPLSDEELEEYVSVSCICKGIPCPKCKKNKIHRPISNSYCKKDNTVWHYPYFTGMRPCDECKGKRENV